MYKEAGGCMVYALLQYTCMQVPHVQHSPDTHIQAHTSHKLTMKIYTFTQCHAPNKYSLQMVAQTTSKCLLGAVFHLMLC